VTAAAAETITRHPWLEGDGEGLRSRLRRLRHVYPDWRYLINAHYRGPSTPLAGGGFILFLGGFMLFAFDIIQVLFLGGVSFVFGLVSMFILSPTLKGYQTYSGSVVEIGEKAHNPELINALVQEVERNEDGMVSHPNNDAPPFYIPEGSRVTQGASVSEYPPESEEKEGGWATSAFGLFRGYLRVAAFMRAYLPPRAGLSLTLGIPCLVLGFVFFLATGVLIAAVERFGLGISEQTIAGYVAVWVFVAFWTLVPGLYYASEKESDRQEDDA